MLIASLMLAAAPPDAARVALGTELARYGEVAQMLPAVELQQTDELLDAHPELSTRERLELRRTAHRVAMAGLERLIAPEGRAYAERLSTEDLRALVAFARSGPAQRMRAAEGAVAAATLKSMRGYDYKREVMRAFCAETGKGCASAAVAGGPELACLPAASLPVSVQPGASR